MGSENGSIPQVDQSNLGDLEEASLSQFTNPKPARYIQIAGTYCPANGAFRTCPKPQCNSRQVCVGNSPQIVKVNP